MKLLNEIIGDEWLSITAIRENPLDVKTQTEIHGEIFGGHKIATAEVRMYADVACAVVYNQEARGYFGQKPVFPDMIPVAEEHKKAGKIEEYYKAIKTAYGVMVYIIECEINPRSNLLRDGPKLTAYKLIKQQNNNLRLILVVFEGTKVDNPGIFDDVWEFKRRGDEEDGEDK